MINNKDINIRMIIHVAKRLGDLRDKVVFVITILDGRPEIVSEIRRSSDDLKDFLSRTFKTLLVNGEFLDSIPGHLSPDRASQSRLPLLIKRLQEIAEISD